MPKIYRLFHGEELGLILSYSSSENYLIHNLVRRPVRPELIRTSKTLSKKKSLRLWKQLSNFNSTSIRFFPCYLFQKFSLFSFLSNSPLVSANQMAYSIINDSFFIFILVHHFSSRWSPSSHFTWRFTWRFWWTFIRREFVFRWRFETSS